jgi:hypothetical protein
MEILPLGEEKIRRRAEEVMEGICDVGPLRRERKQREGWPG